MTRSDSGGIVTYSYDDNDRLLSETGGVGTTYVYDANGNAVSKTTGSLTTEYAYDYEDRLTGILTGSDSVTFQYDPAGDRISKSVNGVTTRYLVDANRAYSEVLAETDVAGNLLTEYVHGNDLISQTRAGVSHWYHYDGQYSVRQLTDVSGTIANSYKYDAFGRLRNQTGSAVNNHLFTGEQYDPHADAYYLRARYYNQTVGRFISADIFPGFNFDPASKNRYAYAASNPVNKYDFSGMFTLTEASKSMSISSVLASTAYSITTVTPRVPTDWWYSITKIINYIPKAVSIYRFFQEEYDKLTATQSIYVDSYPLSTKVELSDPESVWEKNPIQRGREIENVLAETDYKDWFRVGELNNGFFPLVDFQKGNNLVSVKSVDTTGTDWKRRMQEHIKDLGSSGATVDKRKANMILDLRVQPGGVPAAISLIEYGQERGVTIIIKEFIK